MSTLPTSTKAWMVTGSEGPASLSFSELPIPELGHNDVLVKIKGASINSRDVLVSQGKYPWPVKTGVVPGSDGSGVVTAIGKNVTRFKPGDEVITIINQKFIAGSMDTPATRSGLGAELDGTFRTIGIFDEQGLVFKPKALSFTEAATLSCAGVSAWNALFGLAGRPLSPGQWVLTQGTGGVSLFAIQFAKLVGARVIATTSSKGKVQILEKLGADHILNYNEVPNWGEEAKTLTGGVGVDYVIDVAGASTLKQSIASLKLDGILTVMGFAGGNEGKDVPSLLDCWMGLFTARGIWVGNRVHMEDMCRAIEANVEKLRPIVDAKVFKLEQLPQAYEYLREGVHQGKVCIEIDE